MQGEGRPASHKQWALCVFDDLLEFASSSAIKYQEYFLSPMMKCICAKSPSVRQVSWGMCTASADVNSVVNVSENSLFCEVFVR